MDSKYSIGSSAQSTNRNGFNNFSVKRPALQVNHKSPKKPKLAQPSQDQPTTANNFNNNYAISNATVIREHRRQLPVYNVRLRLMDKIKEVPTLIIMGETGSGKTTQIPQFLQEAGYTEKGIIAITQPRRVAAITVATRVAKEKNVRIGELVGYSVRFEDITSDSTKIKFLTDGTLLREALGDRLLRKYRIIILDEAHERTVNTDVLFGIVKEAQRVRYERNMLPLKILVMSATMDVDHFRQYFKAEAIFLEGRTHEVRMFSAIEPQTDYVEACLITLFNIHQNAPLNHDVLMFLTGQEEIELAASRIRQIMKHTSKFDSTSMRVHTLYAALSPQKQLEVFQHVANARKVIIATNIAETSLTISGIRFVIDSGMVKARYHHPDTGMDVLKIERISQAQSLQRCGRAGRETEGQCYRTYTKDEFNAMHTAAVPEILRCNIANVMLQLLGMNIDCRKFDFMDVPKEEALESALRELKLLGAVKDETSADITELGKRMAKFPLDPKYAKLILSAPEFGCLKEILHLVALLSGESIYLNSLDKREEMLTAHNKFVSEYGDHLSLLNVFKAFLEADKPKIFCSQNFFNLRNLQYARDVNKQLQEICYIQGLESSSCINDFDQVRKCLISGLFTNIAELQRDNTYMALSNRQRAKIHPSSVLSGKPLQRYIIFTEFVITQRSFLRTVTAIDPEWIDEVVPDYAAFDNISKPMVANNEPISTGGAMKLVSKTFSKLFH